MVYVHFLCDHEGVHELAVVFLSQLPGNLIGEEGLEQLYATVHNPNCTLLKLNVCGLYDGRLKDEFSR